MSKPRKSSKEQLSLDEHFLSEEARELLRLGKIEKSRRQRKARTLERLRAQGIPPTGRAPFGKRVGDDGRLEDHPEEKKVIAFIVSERRGGRTYLEIVKMCNERGFKGQSGGAINRQIVMDVCAREIPDLKFPRGRRKKNVSDKPPQRAA